MKFSTLPKRESAFPLPITFSAYVNVMFALVTANLLLSAPTEAILFVLVAAAFFVKQYNHLWAVRYRVPPPPKLTFATIKTVWSQSSGPSLAQSNMRLLSKLRPDHFLSATATEQLRAEARKGLRGLWELYCYQLQGRVKGLVKEVAEWQGEDRRLQGVEELVDERIARRSRIWRLKEAVLSKVANDRTQDLNKANANLVVAEREIQRLKLELRFATKDKEAAEAEKNDWENQSNGFELRYLSAQAQVKDLLAANGRAEELELQFLQAQAQAKDLAAENERLQRLLDGAPGAVPEMAVPEMPSSPTPSDAEFFSTPSGASSPLSSLASSGSEAEDSLAGFGPKAQGGQAPAEEEEKKKDKGKAVAPECAMQ